METEKQYLAFDIGGTKLAIGVVNWSGTILHKEILYPDLEKGKDFYFEAMIEKAKEVLRKFPQIDKIGISSCGPLDSRQGLLLDPTNLLSQGKGWGSVPLKDMLEKALRKVVFLENDAACAVLAERHFGVGKTLSCDNLIMLTLGTGLGVGILCNGTLVRGGRHLHPEAGHLIIQYEGSKRQCACGVSGDAESYLSGKHFEAEFCHEYELASPLSALEITKLARMGDERAKDSFNRYAQALAVTLHNLCVLFYPEVIVFDGGFARSFDEFSELTRTYLRKLLYRRQGLDPKLMLSSLDNQSSLLGASYLCQHTEIK
ncbi:MAG: ROK family protein [Deltaproteobacteria bacterium]|nr:ROK family protein [Deltaproteobacteria bacterium]